MSPGGISATRFSLSSGQQYDKEDAGNDGLRDRLVAGNFADHVRIAE